MFTQPETKKHPFIKYANDIKSICKPLEKLYKINYFAYNRIYENKSFTALTNYPEWAEHYLEHCYFNYEDTLKSPSLLKEGYFFWGGDGLKVEITDRKLTRIKQLNKESLRAFDMNHGIAIVKKGPNFADVYHFTSAEKNDSVKVSFVKQLNLLENFIAYFRSVIAANKSLLDIYKRQIQVTEATNFFSDVTLDLGLKLKNQRAFLKEISLKRYYLREPFNNVYLTKREVECIKLLLQRKSIKEIATYLDIETRTAEAHLCNVKNKMGCHSIRKLLQILEKEAWLYF